MTEFKRMKKIEDRCPFMAKYVISGHQLCMHHMRCEAVAIVMDKGLCKRLSTPPPVSGQHVRIAK